MSNVYKRILFLFSLILMSACSHSPKSSELINIGTINYECEIKYKNEGEESVNHFRLTPSEALKTLSHGCDIVVNKFGITVYTDKTNYLFVYENPLCAPCNTRYAYVVDGNDGTLVREYEPNILEKSLMYSLQGLRALTP